MTREYKYIDTHAEHNNDTFKKHEIESICCSKRSLKQNKNNNAVPRKKAVTSLTYQYRNNKSKVFHTNNSFPTPVRTLYGEHTGPKVEHVGYRHTHIKLHQKLQLLQ